LSNFKIGMQYLNVHITMTIMMVPQKSGWYEERRLAILYINSLFSLIVGRNPQRFIAHIFFFNLSAKITGKISIKNDKILNKYDDQRVQIHKY